MNLIKIRILAGSGLLLQAYARSPVTKLNKVDVSMEMNTCVKRFLDHLERLLESWRPISPRTRHIFIRNGGYRYKAHPTFRMSLCHAKSQMSGWSGTSPTHAVIRTFTLIPCMSKLRECLKSKLIMRCL